MLTDRERMEADAMVMELRRWLDEQTITGDNIGEIRMRCSMPWASEWNALVRDETAKREKWPNVEAVRREASGPVPG